MGYLPSRPVWGVVWCVLDIYLGEDAERELMSLALTTPHRYEDLARALRLALRSGFLTGGFSYVRSYEDGLTRFYHPTLDVNLYVSDGERNGPLVIMNIGIG